MGDAPSNRIDQFLLFHAAGVQTVGATCGYWPRHGRPAGATRQAFEAAVDEACGDRRVPRLSRSHLMAALA